jgi:hypothetical protein
MKGKPELNNKQAVDSLSEVALREQIEKRAYHLWLAAGGRHGEDLRHWLQAEAEVLKAIKQDREERSLSAKPKLRPSPLLNESSPQ